MMTFHCAIRTLAVVQRSSGVHLKFTDQWSKHIGPPHFLPDQRPITTPSSGWERFTLLATLKAVQSLQCCRSVVGGH